MCWQGRIKANTYVSIFNINGYANVLKLPKTKVSLSKYGTSPHGKDDTGDAPVL